MLTIKASFPYEFYHHDYNDVYSSRYSRDALLAGSVYEQLTGWHERNPRLRVFSAGKSALGQRIPAAAIGNMKRPVLFAGGFTGFDRIGVLLLLRFLHDLADPQNADFLKSNNILSYFERGGIVVLPMCHPDGFLKNGLRFVSASDTGPFSAAKEALPDNPDHCDLRLKFSLPPKNKTGQSKHMAEPAEARAILKLCRSFSFRRAVDFCPYGEKILFSECGAAGTCTTEICAALGTSAALGSELVSSCCGYALKTGDAALEPGSFKDRFVSLSGKEGYTIKIGRNGYIPVSELEPLYARLLQSMLLLMIL